MTKFRLSAALEVSEVGRIQFGYDVTDKDLDEMGGERELAIFLVCEDVSKEFRGKRPIFKTMNVWLRPLSDQAWG